MWVKCRQCRLTLLSNLSEPSLAVGQCRKKARRTICGSAAKGMFHLPFHFVRDEQELNAQLFPSSSRRVRIVAALAH
jgi:hypothetical protein